MKRKFYWLFISIFIVVGAGCKSQTEHAKIAGQKDANAQIVKQEDANKLYNLGMRYSKGDGVEKDMAKAVECWRKAAEQGNAKAQYEVGSCYSKGDGVQYDINEAVKWWSKAAEQGHARAQSMVGMAYAAGNGVQMNITTAVEWFRKAAEQGDPWAQTALGQCYRYGDGIQKDISKSVEWYRKAAEQGDAKGLFALGMFYEEGEGVEKNTAKAVELFRKAAEQGHPDAIKRLQELKRYEEEQKAPSVTVEKDADLKKKIDNAEKALQLINHFSTILYRITDSRDLALLELEYDRISQENIFLDVIEDDEIIAIIQDIMKFITKQIINSEEREKLQKWLKEDIRNAVFKTCPNPTRLISVNPKDIATAVSQFAFSWYFHYATERKRLERAFEKQEWELDKDQVTFLNDRNIKLLEMYWRLVKKYDIKDAQRITTDEIKEFLKYADDNKLDENLIYKELSLPQNHIKYKKFPEFWYRLGRAAEKMNKHDEAISAYRQYQSIYLQFLRKDHMAAEVALNLAKLMVEAGNYQKSDMLEQLSIIENNVNADDWTYLLFCGSLYTELGEYQLARQVLAKAVHEQERLLSFEYSKFVEKLKTKGKLSFLNYPQQSSYQLMMCRYAYLQACNKELGKEALGKEFSEICEDKMTSGFETMTYAGYLYKNLPVEQWLNLYNIVAYPDGDIDFHLPMNWFYLGNEDTYLDLTVKNPEENLPRLLKTTIITYSTTEEPIVYTENVEDRKFRYNKDKNTGEENFWVNVETPVKHKNIAKRNINRLELVLPLRDMTITLVYLARPDDLQLFPKKMESYHPTSFKIDNVEYNFWNYR